MGVCVGLTNGKDNSKTQAFRCFWAKTDRGEEGGLLSGSAEAKQLSINLLFTTRAAASVGYAELPLAFQKSRHWVPSVLCQAALLALTQHRPGTSDIINPNHIWNVGCCKRFSSPVPGKQRESWGCCGCCIQPPEIHPRYTCTELWASLLHPNIYKLTHTCRSGSHCVHDHTLHWTVTQICSMFGLLFNFIFHKFYKNVHEKSCYALVIV